MEQTDNTTSRIFEVLSDICSECPKRHNARVVAAVVYKRKIVSIGTNNGRSDPWQARFSRHDNIWLHAEIQAIKRAHSRIGEKKLTKSTLYVCRLTESPDKTTFSRALAKPCTGCQSAINTFGLKRVMYTTGPSSLSDVINTEV